MKRVLLCAFMSVFFIAGAAQAYERKQSYLGVEAGFFQAGSAKIFGENVNADFGGDFGLKYNYYFAKGRQFSLGGSAHIGRMIASYDNGNDESRRKGDFSATRFGLGLSGVAKVSKSIDILLSGGVTFNLNELEIEARQRGYDGGYTTTKDSSSFSSVGGFASAGVNYLITPSFAIGLACSYYFNDYSAENVVAALGGWTALITAGFMF